MTVPEPLSRCAVQFCKILKSEHFQLQPPAWLACLSCSCSLRGGGLAPDDQPEAARGWHDTCIHKSGRPQQSAPFRPSALPHGPTVNMAACHNAVISGPSRVSFQSISCNQIVPPAGRRASASRQSRRLISLLNPCRKFPMKTPSHCAMFHGYSNASIARSSMRSASPWAPRIGWMFGSARGTSVRMTRLAPYSSNSGIAKTPLPPAISAT